MDVRSFLVFVLLATIVPLTPMAYASPPDPVWVKGYFDDGDFDDVVVLLTSAGAAFDACPVGDLQPVLVVLTAVRAPATSRLIAGPPLSTEARAPPAV